ncbi:NUDIX hydrolase [Neobacillus sp. YIM B06451]|uniref:NUDIX hydrolase n=1 Tax=Neobacillus sp. YIM B06451 TaxID=3070994 RepID=UPI0029304082|nr:NUDIX hydrolase [Neobacillus sp. YIM B06451]
MRRIMQNRERAFAAIIKDGCILMVHESNGCKDFWTLPGGGLENDETFDEAVVREVREEVNLEVKVVKHLFTGTYEYGVEKCFLAELINPNSVPTLGLDPEFPADQQNLTEVKWQPIKKMVDDIQVSEVIKVLGIKV